MKCVDFVFRSVTPGYLRTSKVLVAPFLDVTSGVEGTLMSSERHGWRMMRTILEEIAHLLNKTSGCLREHHFLTSRGPTCAWQNLNFRARGLRGATNLDVRRTPVKRCFLWQKVGPEQRGWRHVGLCNIPSTHDTVSLQSDQSPAKRPLPVGMAPPSSLHSYCQGPRKDPKSFPCPKRC